MLLRSIGYRRSYATKLIALSLIFATYVFYTKFIYTNTANDADEDAPYASHRKLIAGKLVNEYNGPNAIDVGGDNFQAIPAIQSTIELSSDASLAHRHHYNAEYEKWIGADIVKQERGLGNGGRSAILSSPAAHEIGERQLKKIALNEELSEHLSYNRTLQDARNPLCQSQRFNVDDLPTTSIIIIFFNEPYSVLVRTVHSVLNTVDRRILKEIILVDDSSTKSELKGKLDYYIETRLPQNIVHIIHLKHRLGLIRARLAGARTAKGDVLVFLDAHCEANTGWMEPLLTRIKESPTSVLVPIIDVIDAKDFHYSINGNRNFQVGGFTWNGHFDWINVSPAEKSRLKKKCGNNADICPTYSPTMAGGLFAISRSYFWDIGSYDEQMNGWGGENLEMSFRIWQCGGTIETIPCSRVGHIFRDFHPYQFPDNKDTHGINTVRLALVWMDEYINLFYLNRPDLKNHPDIGDVTHRLVLRDKLKCKSFDWYLKNVYPNKFIPTKDVQSYGRVSAMYQNLCLDDLQADNEKPYNLGVYSCHRGNVTRSQFFSLTNTGVLRNELSCATIQQSDSDKSNVVMAPCHENDDFNESWELTAHNQLRHTTNELCMDFANLNVQEFVYAQPCDELSETQKWAIEH